MGNKGNRTGFTNLSVDRQSNKPLHVASPSCEARSARALSPKKTPDMGEQKFPNDREGALFPFLCEKLARPYRADPFTQRARLSMATAALRLRGTNQLSRLSGNGDSVTVVLYLLLRVDKKTFARYAGGYGTNQER